MGGAGGGGGGKKVLVKVLALSLLLLISTVLPLSSLVFKVGILGQLPLLASSLMNLFAVQMSFAVISSR